MAMPRVDASLTALLAPSSATFVFAHCSSAAEGVAPPYSSPNSFAPLSFCSDWQSSFASLALIPGLALPATNWVAASLVATALSTAEAERKSGAAMTRPISW